MITMSAPDGSTVQIDPDVAHAMEALGYDRLDSAAEAPASTGRKTRKRSAASDGT